MSSVVCVFVSHCLFYPTLHYTHECSFSCVSVPGTYTWTCKKDVQAKLKKLIEEQEGAKAS